MGMSDTWIISQEPRKETLWEFFGLEEVRQKPLRPEFGYVELPDGWSVVWAGSDRFHGRRELIDVSRLGMALRLHVHDKGTYLSALTAAEGGKPLWEVVIGEDEKLVLKGPPPLKIGELRALTRDFDEQMGGDHDVPIALAKSLTGFDIDVFFENVRYLKPMPGSALAAPPPGWLLRNVGRPLWRAITWWWNFSDAAGKRTGELVEILVSVWLFVGALAAPLIFLAWILGVIWRAL